MKHDISSILTKYALYTMNAT